MKHWIVIADASGARVFSIADRYAKLRFVKTLQHPQGRLLDQELTSDGPGRVNKAGAVGTRSAIAPRTSAHDDTALQFARELTGFLRQAHADKTFESFSLIAPAHFLGIVRQLLGTALEKAMTASLPHDLMHIPTADLDSHIEPLLTTPGLFLA